MKRALFIIGGVIALLALVVCVAPLFVDLNRYKPRLEARASQVLGVEVRIGGRLGIGLFPGFHVNVSDVALFGESHESIGSVKRARVWLELLPLLHKQVRLRGIDFSQPKLSIERDAHGRVHLANLKRLVGLLGVMDGGRLSLSEGSLVYADRKTGRRLEASGCGLSMSGMRRVEARTPRAFLAEMTFNGQIACREIRTNGLALSGLKGSVDGRNGVFAIDSATVQIFGGRMTGAMEVNCTDTLPAARIRGSLSRFRIEDLLGVVSPEKSLRGTMDLATDVSMQGMSLGALARSATGELSLRGENLTLEGGDLDRDLSRYESTRTLDLIRDGAVLFAGPMGLAVSRGQNFAGLFRNTGGNSTIRALVSNWQIDHGIAQARDVAMATQRNRLALRGVIDFVHREYANVTVAVIDEHACPKAIQAIYGSFAEPTVEPPRVIRSLATPVLDRAGASRSPCDPFYSGSVAAPN